jgi:hypothetical protein
MQRLERRRAGGDDVSRAAASAAFLHDPLQHGAVAAAPDLHLDGVFLRERLDDRCHVLGHARGVEGERAFLAGALDQLRQPVRSLIVRELRQSACLREGLRGCHNP